MDNENFMVSICAVIIGVLPILFFSIIACERKKSRRASTQSHRKKTSSKRKLSTSSKKSSTLKSDKCTECERFDAQVDAAINSRNNISISQTNGGCNINGYEITPKRCEHGNGRDIIIDRPQLQLRSCNNNTTVRAGHRKQGNAYTSTTSVTSNGMNVVNSDGSKVIMDEHGMRIVRSDGSVVAMDERGIQVN